MLATVRLAALATLLVTLDAASAAAEPQLSGRVRMVMRGQLDAGALGRRAGEPRALVSVRVTGGARALSRLGLEARPLAGDLAAVTATADELRRLAALPGVVSVEERRLLWPTLDVSGPAVGAPAARAQTGLDGTGVLVGVVDTGADFRHADLRWADGRTKIAAMLDLNTPSDSRHAELGNFGGAIWLRDEIDARLADEAAGRRKPQPQIAERDTNGHGTHVCAVATSTGLATGRGLPAGRYVGMAPGAELVVAQATHGGSSFTDVDVLSAVQFVVEQATALGRPMVVNLSLGGSGGGHDGTTHLEQGLDELVPANAAGRALVVAAGNDGARDLHAGGWALDGAAVVPLVLPTSAQRGTVTLELWFSGDPSIAVETPRGRRLGPVGAGDAGDGKNTIEGHVLVDNVGPARSDGRRNATVTLSTDGGPVAAGTWRIEVAGRAARWDAWIVDGPAGTRFADHIDVDDRLALPAATHNAISVGAWTSRASWTNVDGTPIMRNLTVGDPATFSATGPTSDGRFAPDLVAPGEFIAAALSADASPDQPTSAFYAGSSPHLVWADDGVHGLLRGTSQAAPHVAGAVALLLQADPSLTATQIREILRVSARSDGTFGFSTRLGFGRLDVLGAVEQARGQRGAGASATTSTVGVSRDALPPGEETTTVSVTPRDAAGVPLGAGHEVEIDVSAGLPLGGVVDTGEGRYEQIVIAHASRGSVATVTARVDGVEVAEHPPIFFVAARDEIGRPFRAAGGGCSLGAGDAATGLELALALVWLLRPRRKSRRTA
jgi:subtilisin family serine protease